MTPSSFGTQAETRRFWHGFGEVGKGHRVVGLGYGNFEGGLGGEDGRIGDDRASLCHWAVDITMGLLSLN